MIQTVVGKSTDRPPIKSGCQWGAHGLVLAHSRGLVSVFRGQQLMLSIQTLGEEIAFLRAIEQRLYISYKSGLFACYSLPLGIFEQQVQLPGPVDGMYLQEQSVVVWGTGTQVLFLNRFSLDIISKLEFDSKPVRVCRDKHLAVVLRSGQIHWINNNDSSFIAQVNLPLDQYKFGPLIDAACIDVGKWVCVQRNRWSIIEQKPHETGFVLEFHASAPDLLQTLCVSSLISTFAIACDSGQILLVENNNIQVLEPQWPPYALKFLAYSKNIPLAVLDSCIYEGELNKQAWSWARVPSCSFTQASTWLIRDNHAAYGCVFGILGPKCDFKPMYTAETPISAFWVDEDITYLGLENGSLITEFTRETRALNTAIKYLAKDGSDGLVAVAGDHTVSLLYDLPVIIPVNALIEGIQIQGNALYICTGAGYKVYDLETLKLVEGAPTLMFDPVPYTRVHEPFVQATAMGELLGFKLHNNVSLFNSNASKWTAAAIYTIKCAFESMSLHQADQELRKMGVSVEQFEKLLVLLKGQDDKLRMSAISLLQSLTDNKRIEMLMQQGGIRPSLIFSAVYPDIPVGDWLTKSINSLLSGDITDQLVGLQILAQHTELHHFPFKELDRLGIETVTERFILEASSRDPGGITTAICEALDTKDFTYFSLCIACITCMIKQSRVTIESPNFTRLIGAVSRAVHRTPTGMGAVRKLFASLLSIYSNDVLFNKERQLLFVKLYSKDKFGVVWELQNGKHFMLAAPVVSLTRNQGKSPSFSEDGKRIQCGETTWNLPGAIASLFGSQQLIHAVNS